MEDIASLKDKNLLTRMTILFHFHKCVMLSSQICSQWTSGLTYIFYKKQNNGDMENNETLYFMGNLRKKGLLTFLVIYTRDPFLPSLGEGDLSSILSFFLLVFFSSAFLRVMYQQFTLEFLSM
jgi:hypothetical protein